MREQEGKETGEERKSSVGGIRERDEDGRLAQVSERREQKRRERSRNKKKRAKFLRERNGHRT